MENTSNAQGQREWQALMARVDDSLGFDMGLFELELPSAADEAQESLSSEEDMLQPSAQKLPQLQPPAETPAPEASLGPANSMLQPNAQMQLPLQPPALISPGALSASPAFHWVNTDLKSRIEATITQAHTDRSNPTTTPHEHQLAEAYLSQLQHILSREQDKKLIRDSLPLVWRCKEIPAEFVHSHPQYKVAMEWAGNFVHGIPADLGWYAGIILDGMGRADVEGRDWQAWMHRNYEPRDGGFDEMPPDYEEWRRF